MPARKERLPLQKVTVKLFEGEFAKLASFYPKSGANRIIREMVHRHISVVEETAQRNVGALAALDVDLSDMGEVK